MYLLNIVEVREPSDETRGFYIFETRFGQEVLKKISLDVLASDTSDVLLYRYLSEPELAAVKSSSLNRKFYVVLHNLMNLDYVAKELVTENTSQFNFVVDMSRTDSFKPFNYANKIVQSKNYFRIKRVVQNKPGVQEKSSFHLPVFFLVLLKILINPINELKRFYILAKFSNLRVLTRFVELVLFIDFVVRAIIVKSLKLVGIRVFYRGSFLAGLMKVIGIKLGYFFRHIVMMGFYKAFGFFVDGFNFIVRLKDIFVGTVYYKFLHKIYHNYLKKVLDFLLYKVILAFYHNVLKRIFDFVFHKVIVEFLVYGVILKFYHNVLKRIFDFVFYKVVVEFLYFRVIHYFYHNYLKKLFDFVFHKVIVEFLVYGLILKFYHNVLNKIFDFVLYAVLLNFYHHGIKKLYNFILLKLINLHYHLVVPGFNFLRLRIYVFVRFKLTHYVVMGFFKVYGLLYDLFMLTYRFTKLVLLYPFFKVYWFFKYQYEKRLKKYFV